MKASRRSIGSSISPDGHACDRLRRCVERHHAHAFRRAQDQGRDRRSVSRSHRRAAFGAARSAGRSHRCASGSRSRDGQPGSVRRKFASTRVSSTRCRCAVEGKSGGCGVAALWLAGDCARGRRVRRSDVRLGHAGDRSRNDGAGHRAGLVAEPLRFHRLAAVTIARCGNAWSKRRVSVAKPRVKGASLCAATIPMRTLFARRSKTSSARSCEALSHIERRELEQLTRQSEAPTGLVVTNPPYGERIGDQEQLQSLYETFGAKLREHFEGWKAAVLTGNPPLAKAIGINARRTHTLFNGRIECRLLRFDVAPADYRGEQRSPPDEAQTA